MESPLKTAVLDIFSLRDAIVDEYKRFAMSFTTIFANDVRSQVESIYAAGRYWPEPLIQINANYRKSTNIQSLVAAGELEPACAAIFQLHGKPLDLYKHQEQSIALAAEGESYVVTTGTGSGKSLCFFIPIVNRILIEKRQDTQPRTRAIIIYPMNALANSQREEFEKYLSGVGDKRPVTFARYTGQEDAEERRRIADFPPDILLTNFMMLELLMTRQDEVDRRVIDHCVGLRFLVLDELHTYRGRQGADVALLVRRVRERLRPEALQCIGTSATMASEGSIEEKNRVVARVASKLFSLSIPESNVIVETLERITDKAQTAESVQKILGPAIDQGISAQLTDAALAMHPLAIWIETRLGIRFSERDQRWVRARPMTVTEAVQALSRAAERPVEQCKTALRELLLISSVPEGQRLARETTETRSLFAFKLHQFISGTGSAFATLEAAGIRTVTVEGQRFLPSQPEKRLYPIHFCRECGHEYYVVRLVDEQGTLRAHARDIDDAPSSSEDAAEKSSEEKDLYGFVSLNASGDPGFSFTNEEEDFPEAWLEPDAGGRPRLKPYYRSARPKELRITPEGLVGSGIPCWFLPGKFRFCLRCGNTTGGAVRDRTRLASLSAEGRSSATTVLAASILKWMHGPHSGLEKYTRKLLGFTDNRQDAALQAGHFNDFMFVSLVRAGFLGALLTAGSRGLRSEELGAAHQKTLGFDRPSPELRAEWLLEPGLKGFNLQEAETTLRQVLAYRVWFDQRRGWRYTIPNLEQLGLVQVDYLGLEALSADESEFSKAHPLLKNASPRVRCMLFQELLDHMRKGMAIRCQVLEPSFIEQLVARSHSRLRSPWRFAAGEGPLGARWLMVSAPKRKQYAMRDLELIIRAGSRSGLGKALRASRVWAGDGAIRALKSKEFDGLVEDLLKAAASHGLVQEEPTPFDQTGWRLNDACVLFRLGAAPGHEGRSSRENTFFRSFYTNLAAMLGAPLHPLFGFEAREHTAQVESERRSIREKRFRYGEKERLELTEDEKKLRELDEANRFLPVLFCSPTMELGVDIAALNVVHMRNVPPTPANYAQRSGRAGRSGQAALVLTYASSQSPHDQYFFRDPRAMVHGEVKAPLLDLANRELVDSHLQAVWLSCVEKPLDSCIAELLLLGEPKRPIAPALAESMHPPSVSRRAADRIRKVLELIEEELTPEAAQWYTGKDAYATGTVATAFERFDHAFDRWRDLFLAAEEQRDAARRTMDDYTAPYAEKRAAQVRHAQALDQINLLQRGNNPLTSDFYTYRYLATEGFLPGYNFPRLPLLAYIPGTADGGARQTYLQRPRFLALSEFGPRSLIYHEGRAFRVVRALLSLGRRDLATPDAQLPTKVVRICAHCGAGHFEDQSSVCHACGCSLGTADVVKNVYRIENMATRQADRITANDEERQRQGFELQTTFQWAMRDHALDVRRTVASDPLGEVARLAYGPGATIIRLNRGLRRRANKSILGFQIDPISGYWAKNDDEPEENADPSVARPQWIVPSVRDHKNALLFTPSLRGMSEVGIATAQYALLRGIEAVFQLEEGEVLAEPMPTRDTRNGFLLYEATEGGAGVLVRLVSEQGTLATVARRALHVMHFDLPATGPLPSAERALVDLPDTSCVAACYRCLMSYFNQPDHERIDRRNPEVRALLLRLATARIQSHASVRDEDLSPAAPESLAHRWRQEASEQALPAPDSDPIDPELAALTLVWRRHYVAVSLQTLSPKQLVQLEDLGFDVISFEDQSTWDVAFRHLAPMLGRRA